MNAMVNLAGSSSSTRNDADIDDFMVCIYDVLAS